MHNASAELRPQTQQKELNFKQQEPILTTSLAFAGAVCSLQLDLRIREVLRRGKD
jgi:hypothetical protein